MDALVLETVQSLLPLVILVSLRIAIALLFLPAPFDSESVNPMRAIMSLLIAVAICLPNAHLAQGVPTAPFALLGAALGEATVGAVIGLTVRTMLAAAEIAGHLGGFAMGLGFAHSVDPFTAEDAVPSSQLLYSLAGAVFLILQGHHVVLSALAASVRFAPPGHALGAVSSAGVLRTGSTMMAHGLQIAAPVIGTMFIIHVGKSMITKAAPKVHMLALFFAVTIAAGLLTLSVAAPSVATAIAALIHRLPEELARSLGAR